METKKRVPTWLIVIGVAACLPFAVAAAVWEYVNATATPLHPDPHAISSVARSAPSAQWADAVEQGRRIVREALIEQNLPGLSVAVGVGSDIVWAEGFGFSDLEYQIAVTPETRFRIGTESTVLTSAAAALLLEKNRLKLDEKIQTYVPEFPEKKWPVTLRQVMGHMAGLRNDGGDEGPLFSVHCERPKEALEHFKEGSLRFEPGTEYRFSNYDWILVSAAIEAAANEPFLKFMHEQVFAPLGMDHTDDDAAAKPIPGRASFYFPRFGGDPKYGPDPMRPLDYSCYAGSSVFVSTPSDLARFGMGLNGGKLLEPATLKLLQSSQVLASGYETGYGLGWDIETATLAGNPARWVGHDGMSLGGMVSSLMTFPEHGLVVSVTSNISYADTESLALKIAQAFAERGKK